MLHCESLLKYRTHRIALDDNRRNLSNERQPEKLRVHQGSLTTQMGGTLRDRQPWTRLLFQWVDCPQNAETADDKERAHGAERRTFSS